MKPILKSVRKCFSYVLLTNLVLLSVNFQTAFGAPGDTRYISDILYVPMRTGPGTEYRIIHQGLRTGTRLTVLQEDVGNGYIKVKTNNGLEGFVRDQYLISSEPAQERLPKIQEQADGVMRENQSLKKQLADLEKEISQVKVQLTTTKQQLDDQNSDYMALKEATADPVALDRKNKQLIEENLQLKSRVSVVEVDNAQLEQDRSVRWYLYGGGSILLGVVLGLFLPMLHIRRKSSSDWV